MGLRSAEAMNACRVFRARNARAWRCAAVSLRVRVVFVFFLALVFLLELAVFFLVADVFFFAADDLVADGRAGAASCAGSTAGASNPKTRSRRSVTAKALIPVTSP